MVTVTVTRQYNAMISCYRLGLSDETWRNQSDGTCFAVGTSESTNDLQSLMDKITTLRTSEFYQYHHIVVRITSYCAKCYGRQRIHGVRHGTSKVCPGCKGKPTDQEELTLTI